MHFAFIPYGTRQEVEIFLRELEAQKHHLKMKSPDGKEYVIPIQGRVRQLPLGVYEYIFPKEDMGMVLNTFLRHGENRYDLPGYVLKFLRKFYRYDKIPEFKTDKYYLWVMDFVNIIPLGIKEDADNFIEPEGTKYKGYVHEAL